MGEDKIHVWRDRSHGSGHTIQEYVGYVNRSDAEQLVLEVLAEVLAEGPRIGSGPIKVSVLRAKLEQMLAAKRERDAKQDSCEVSA